MMGRLSLADIIAVCNLYFPLAKVRCSAPMTEVPQIRCHSTIICRNAVLRPVQLT